jgi:activator of 2-hydroxyglutaryl-CoA dehydratase/predicted nucleotide-binding protein (sugar kinase/HSP70/actin superfamily)
VLERFLGIDLGAETVKVVELTRACGKLCWTARHLVEHGKEPGPRLLELLSALEWETVRGAAVTGRFGRLVQLLPVPVKEAQAAGHRFLHGDAPATVVSIGSHGFSVLELRGSGVEVLRENSRCSQGTGNFLRQLVGRFGLTVEEASELCAGVPDPAPLSGRCPVILKTDMTHLANKGESRERILAGLYDAVCENVRVLVKPRLCPRRVWLIGGVARSARVREGLRSFLSRHGLVLEPPGDEVLFCEALGAATVAAERPGGLPPLAEFLRPPSATHFEPTPPLRIFLGRVKRMAAPEAGSDGDGSSPLVLGFDIGSTGSKAVALGAATRAVVWEDYRATSGDPVGAAQALMARFVSGFAGGRPVLGLGATGSGREIVGSLMATCYGPERTFVLNEIAAHARGARHHEPRVDTIFEIGGQDAKYVRLAGGRVVDAAMNEACSAGTGSFIEEQGRRFPGVADVAGLGEAALAAPAGVSLGQHCSVFMAEVIDEAVAAGVEAGAITAGIYDSIVLNYLNRVKGARDLGQVVFCQGMPFSAPALAAAVARHTGCEVVVPPSPGTVGALGIALLALEQLELACPSPLDPARFLEARVEEKAAFVCQSTRGCGGSGNKCRIERLCTRVGGQRQQFMWGGACSLFDRGVNRRKLPEGAPDPFREREDLLEEVTAWATRPRGGRRIALTDEFILGGLYPFFVTFLHELGLDPVVGRGADQATLKRGIEGSSVPFCAPMQLYHGLVDAMAEEGPDLLFLPMVRGLPRTGDEAHATSCPIAQGSPDLIRWDRGPGAAPAVVSPVIDIGPGNLRSSAFARSCASLARTLGARRRWREAFAAALAAQEGFEARSFERGREALAFCVARGIVPVVVLGRPYTIHNRVLNSNVPALLREQGALPIPVDCYPLEDDVPVFPDVYWGHGQRNLRAAHQVRRTPGVYSLFCSNYSCGPDSFVLHFYGHLMSGKPFAVVETDGHSGDAGTKTRVEVFLHCVREDLARVGPALVARSPKPLEADRVAPAEFVPRGDRVLLVPMGDSVEAAGACLRGAGLNVECLPVIDREALQRGRRHTSGKECLPLTVTLGSVIRRLERDGDGRYVILMPRTCGPCRFGLYHLLQKVILERLDVRDRVKVWSPTDMSYFEDLGLGFAAATISGVAAMDLLVQARLDVHPTETRPGAADRLFRRWKTELLALLERATAEPISAARVLCEVGGGRLFGCTGLLRRAAAEFAAVKGAGDVPTVLVGGEIYVRCEPFANDFLVRRLQEGGLRVRLAPPSEWLEYASEIAAAVEGAGLGEGLWTRLHRRILDVSAGAMEGALGWPVRTSARAALRAATPYIRPDLRGEAVLTLGGALHEWRRGAIDGMISVGPLECMPNKIAEAQLFHVAEQEGLPSLTLSVNGDPVDADTIGRFVYEVRARFRRRQSSTRRSGEKAPAVTSRAAGRAPMPRP